MSHDQSVPEIPKDLMDFLDRSYPERCPNPKDAKREIWMKAGERRLVRRLLTEFKRQEQTVHVHHP